MREPPTDETLLAQVERCREAFEGLGRAFARDMQPAVERARDAMIALGAVLPVEPPRRWTPARICSAVGTALIVVGVVWWCWELVHL